MNHKTLNKQWSLKELYCFLGLDFGNCRNQGFDGAQIFQGHVKDVAKRFKDSSAATSVHCLAQCINLCLQEVTRSCKCIKVAKFMC